MIEKNWTALVWYREPSWVKTQYATLYKIFIAK